MQVLLLPSACGYCVSAAAPDPSHPRNPVDHTLAHACGAPHGTRHPAAGLRHVCTTILYTGLRQICTHYCTQVYVMYVLRYCTQVCVMYVQHTGLPHVCTARRSMPCMYCTQVYVIYVLCYCTQVYAMHVLHTGLRNLCTALLHAGIRHVCTARRYTPCMYCTQVQDSLFLLHICKLICVGPKTMPCGLFMNLNKALWSVYARRQSLVEC